MSGETYSVVGTFGAAPEGIMGEYQNRFDAEAVCAAWNKVNGKHGFSYRVEKDY